MTLEDIKDNIESICSIRPELTDFNYGEEFILDDVSNREPQAFLEIPYSLNFDFNANQKTVQFALLVLFPSSGIDGIVDDHTAISASEIIGDKIIKGIQGLRAQGLFVDSVNGVSVRNIGDSDMCGMRYDIISRTVRAC